jgi:hypothetical protein
MTQHSFEVFGLTYMWDGQTLTVSSADTHQTMDLQTDAGTSTYVQHVMQMLRDNSDDEDGLGFFQAQTRPFEAFMAKVDHSLLEDCQLDHIHTLTDLMQITFDKAVDLLTETQWDVEKAVDLHTKQTDPRVETRARGPNVRMQGLASRQRPT